MMTALFKGLWRVISAPGLVLWLWMVSFALALPAAWMMADTLEESIGASLVDEKMTQSFDVGWFGEFKAAARGLETTFSPTIVGAGAFYNNLEMWLEGGLFDAFPGLVGLGLLFAAVWALFMGGILDRFSEPGRFGLSRFFSSGGRFFFRYLRLAVFAGLLYYLVYRFSGWLFSRIEEATIDVTVERTVLIYTVLAAGLVVILLGFVNMVFDYAKIVTYKEDRRSVILAAVKAFGFVLTHPVKTVGLYFGLGAVGVVMLAIYAWIAPGANQSTFTGVVFAFCVGQAFLISKLMLRLTFYASQMELYGAISRQSDSRLTTIGS